MASFRKRGSSWLAEVRLKGVHKAQSFPTKGEALQWAAEVERKIRAGKGMSVSNRTVRDALDRYGEEVTPKKPSRKWEGARLLWLGKQPFAAKRMDEIGTPDMAAWRDDRLKTVSGSTITRDFNLVSNVFAVARDEWHWIAENPCSKVRRPKENPARKRRVSAGELAALYQVSGTDVATVSARVVLCFEFCIETACRGGEALKLTRSNIRANTVHLPKTKNGDARDVPLSTRASEILHMMPDGFNLTDSQKDSNFRKIRGKAALSDLNFHDSRHEAITRLSKIFDVRDMARVSGHRNLNELMTYFHSDADALAEQMRAKMLGPTKQI